MEIWVWAYLMISRIGHMEQDVIMTFKVRCEGHSVKSKNITKSCKLTKVTQTVQYIYVPSIDCASLGGSK